MPRVPTYDGPQVGVDPSRAGFISTPDAGAPLANISRAASGFADVALRIEARKDQDLAFSTEAAIKKDWIEYDTKLRESRKGHAAETYDADVEKWWTEAAQKHGANLTPGARELASKSLMSSQLQALAQAKAWKESQLNAAAEGSYKAAQGLAIDEAVRVGSPEAAAKAKVDIDARIAARGAREGWSTERAQSERIAHSTVLHAALIDTMARRDPAAAQAYFQRVKAAGELDAKAATQIGAQLEQTSAVVEGGAAADEVWQKMGPRNLEDPIRASEMAKELSTKYANDPARLKAAQQALAEKTHAHDKQQSEVRGANVSTVYKLISSGTPLSKVRLTDTWRALPGDLQSRIIEDIEQQIDRRVRRAADVSTQELNELRKQEALRDLKGKDVYLSIVADTDRLASMSRNEILLQRPVIGAEATEQLLRKNEQLQKPDKKLNAKLDNEIFNDTADRMGLEPNKPRKSEQERRELGHLRMNLETVIDAKQQQLGRELDREERLSLIEKEMAKQITVSRWGFLPDKKVPRAALSLEQAAKVVVPAADRAQITEALKQGYARTKKAEYAPTEENVRRLYLLRTASPDYSTEPAN
jgi:hypothetical protein